MFPKKTISFCPTCYKRIEATIYLEDNAVWMKKECSEHGIFKAMVERDISYYMQCMVAGHRNIYPGYFIDVTQRCNLKCKYCYYGVENTEDPTIESLVQEAYMYRSLAPFIITGGEPSLRKDLPDIIAALQKIGPVELLTNGTGIDGKMFDKIKPLLTRGKGISINLSMHPESKGKDLELVERIEKEELKLESLLFVIDDVKQIDGILSFCHDRRVESVRIKAATRLWAEGKPGRKNKIFVSDMLNYMQKFNPQPVWFRNNKVSFFNTRIGKIFYMLVSWYDAYNVDLLDIGCPPVYRAKTGHVENIVTSALINEGMSKGYLDGRKITQEKSNAS